MNRISRSGVIVCFFMLTVGAARSECTPAEFMVKDVTNVLWTEQLKISFLLTATKEQYDSVKTSWGVAGGYGLYSGSLDYDQAKQSALKESQSRKFDYDRSDYLQYSSQRLSPLAAQMYSKCLDENNKGPGLRMWVAKRERGTYYTLNAFWIGDSAGDAKAKETFWHVEGANLVRKPDPDSWTKGDAQPIAIKKASPDVDAVVTLEVGKKPATLYLLSDLPEPRKIAISVDKPIGISSGGSGRNDGWCQRRTNSGCIHPTKTDGYLESGSGHLVDLYKGHESRTGWNVTRDTPEEICVEVWAATGDCDVELRISGRVAATERYTPVSAVLMPPAIPSAPPSSGAVPRKSRKVTER
jgi:hypothetical protein